MAGRVQDGAGPASDVRGQQDDQQRDPDQLGANEPHSTREWIEGQNYDAEISEVNQDIHELAHDPLADGFLTRMAELTAKLSDLTEKNKTRVPGHYDKRDTGMTVGAHFHGLDYDGQREYLKTRDIRAEKGSKREGVPGVRLVIDGEDYGVIRLTHNASARFKTL